MIMGSASAACACPVRDWSGADASSVLARGSHEQEELVIVRCDMEKLEDIRRNWPFLRDRRIDAYSDLTKRWVDDSSLGRTF